MEKDTNNQVDSDSAGFSGSCLALSAIWLVTVIIILASYHKAPNPPHTIGVCGGIFIRRWKDHIRIVGMI